MSEDEKPEKYPETYDPLRGVGILSGKPPSDAAYGPLRRPPAYYAGQTYKGRQIQNHDVERHQNGTVPGKRDKKARRLIRNALKRRYAKTEQAPQLVRDMKAQAVEIAKEEGRGSRFARRLLEKELAIHQPVYAPTKKELRKLRTEKRARLRKGLAGDAIGELVDRMAKKP